MKYPPGPQERAMIRELLENGIGYFANLTGRTKSALDALDALDDFQPDAKHINALPRKLKDYICDLETRADPAGDVGARVLAEDQVVNLGGALADAHTEITRLRALEERLGNAATAMSGKWKEGAQKNHLLRKALSDLKAENARMARVALDYIETHSPQQEHWGHSMAPRENHLCLICWLKALLDTDLGVAGSEEEDAEDVAIEPEPDKADEKFWALGEKPGRET